MKISTTLIAAITAAFILEACEQQGPLEEAGERADEAIEETSEDIVDAVDKAADNLDDACEEAKEAAGAEETDC